MLSTTLRSTTNRPPLLLRHPPSSTMTQKLLRQSQAILNHPSVAHQWQRSLSVLPSMNILPTTRAINTDGNLTSLPSRGQEGIRRLCSNTSHNIMPANNFWKSSSLHTTTTATIIPAQQQVRQFSSNGNLGNIFQHAQHNNSNKKPGETLEQYGVDLTQLAKEGKLDPVIGRHEEIRRTLQILARRTKNNPVLIGEPGVGK